MPIRRFWWAATICATKAIGTTKAIDAVKATSATKTIGERTSRISWPLQKLIRSLKISGSCFFLLLTSSNLAGHSALGKNITMLDQNSKIQQSGFKTQINDTCRPFGDCSQADVGRTWLNLKRKVIAFSWSVCVNRFQIIYRKFLLETFD